VLTASSNEEKYSVAFNVLKVGVRPTQWRGLPQLKLSDSSTVPQLMISLRSFTTNHHDVEVQAETLVVFILQVARGLL
jgi:hypothetical protein